MRAFLAIEPLGDALSALQGLVGTLEGHKGWLRPVKKEQLHLTLRFFKDFSGKKAEALKDALSGTELKGFTTQLQNIGCFPKWKRPRVIWVGCSAVEEWRALHSAVEEKLAALGFDRDRKFHPHITIARVKGPAASEEQFEEVKNLTVAQEDFPVTELLLKKSVLTPKGAEHTILWKVPLGKAQDI